MTFLIIAMIALAVMGVFTTVYFERKYAGLSWSEVFRLSERYSVKQQDDELGTGIEREDSPEAGVTETDTDVQNDQSEAQPVSVKPRPGRQKRRVTRSKYPIRPADQLVYIHPAGELHTDQKEEEVAALAQLAVASGSAPRVLAVEGIGPTHASKLRNAGVETTLDLIVCGATRERRADLAKQTGLDEEQILRWTNMADLMRIRGVGEEYSELLEAAGVDTVKELRERNPDDIYKAIATVNAERKLVRHLPGSKQIASWVEDAKTIKVVLTY